MSAVVIVFVVWFAIVVAAGITAIALAPKIRGPEWFRVVRTRWADAIEASVDSVGRIITWLVLGLAGWSVVLITGWLLGMLAHQIEPSVDKPAFNWWQSHHLGGHWSSVWWALTEIGSPRVTQG